MDIHIHYVNLLLILACLLGVQNDSYRCGLCCNLGQLQLYLLLKCPADCARHASIHLVDPWTNSCMKPVVNNYLHSLEDLSLHDWLFSGVWLCPVWCFEIHQF